jgi:hypothetical protein
MEKMPFELLDIIFSYLPDCCKLRLNKYNYAKYHKIVMLKLVKNKCESYIRCMVRQDNEFIINQLLVENYNRWIHFKNYYFRGLEFDDYISFLKYYAIENNSEKCENEICKYIESMKNKI